MTKKSEPFTHDELEELARRRLRSRERLRQLEKTITPEEDTAIEAAAKSDPDAPPTTEEQFARMRPAHEVVPDLVRRSLGGRPLAETPKHKISIRLDQEVVDFYRATGPGWQGRINEKLREGLPKSRGTGR